MCFTVQILVCWIDSVHECCLQRAHFKSKRLVEVLSRGWEPADREQLYLPVSLLPSPDSCCRQPHTGRRRAQSSRSRRYPRRLFELFKTSWFKVCIKVVWIIPGGFQLIWPAAPVWTCSIFSAADRGSLVLPSNSSMVGKSFCFFREIS